MNTTTTTYAALIGMDWGHERHAIALRPEGGALEQRTLEHSAENLHAWLDELHQRFGGRPLALAIESSRGAVIHALARRDWITVYPIHPKTSARYREAFTPSGAKDDQPDADVLLALIERHRDRLKPLHRDDDSTRRLDLFCRARRTAVDLRTQLLNRLQSLLQGYFPQALELCGEHLGAPLALDLLARWPTLAALQKVRSQTLRAFYYTHNVRRPESVDARVQRVAEARALTDDAVVIDVSVAQVQGLIAALRPLQKHIATLDETIAQVFATHPDAALFRDLPGAGKVLAPRLAAAFGTDRTRYPEAESLGRFAGILPVLERSGGRKWVHWRWSAPKFLRQSFVEWAVQTTRYCAWARAYYQLQKGRGKRPHAIYRALAAKWLRILWRCWHDRTPYDDARYCAALEKQASPLHALLAAA
ncbi:MAG: IS110 family transposase [Acidobacteriota bacterium]